MNTYSHLLMTAGLDKALPRIPIIKQAFLLGSVAPDLPLWMLSVGGIVYYHFMRGWSLADTGHLLFDELYFHNPFWIAAHNTLHAPVLLGLGLAYVWPRRRNIGSRTRWLFWFLLACLFHTTVDILTHVDDGPLLFFPLNWSLRFHSAISYWDSRYYGHQFQWFEKTLDLALLVYLLRERVCRYLRRQSWSQRSHS